MRQVEVMEAHLSTPRLQAVRAELKQTIRGVRLENHLRRLWAKVNKNGPVPAHSPGLGPCWLWTGYTSGNGYGQVAIDRVRMRAHQFFYRLLVGPYPPASSLTIFSASRYV
jgi:hypothetical protein